MQLFTRTTKGFSLIELLIYIALLSVIVVVVVSVLLSLTRAYGAFKVSQRINNSAITALERITRDSRNAESIDLANSTFDVHPGRLTLNTGTMTIEIYLDGDVLKVREDGVDIGSLTTQRVSVSSFVLRHLFSGSIEAIKIELTLTSSQGEFTKTERFYSAAVLRDTYF